MMITIRQPDRSISTSGISLAEEGLYFSGNNDKARQQITIVQAVMILSFCTAKTTYFGIRRRVSCLSAAQPWQ